jgi:hypothetical protein
MQVIVRAEVSRDVQLASYHKKTPAWIGQVNRLTHPMENTLRFVSIDDNGDAGSDAVKLRCKLAL